MCGTVLGRSFWAIGSLSGVEVKRGFRVCDLPSDAFMMKPGDHLGQANCFRPNTTPESVTT